MMRRVKWIAAAIGIILLLSAVALYLVMANEGYPTLAGVRNLFQRDGQIRIELPRGYSLVDVHFEGDGPYSTVISGNVATIRVGYTRARIDLGFVTKGRKGHVTMGDVTKLNNWNRLVFHAESESDGRLSFQVDENGVARNPGNYAIIQESQSEPGDKP